MSGGSGFGALPFGTGELGTTFSVDSLDVSEAITVSDAVAVAVPFEVADAVSLSETLVRVDFTGFIDPGHATNFDAANYTIPGLTVLSAGPFGTSKSVILQTSTQSAISYTVTVDSTAGQVEGVGGDQLDPLNNTASFQGNSQPASFTATPQSRRKIRLHFSVAMLVDAELIDPANYLITGFDGSGVGIESIATTGGDATRAEILLSGDLLRFTYYTLRIGPNVRTPLGDFVFPDQALIRWEEVIPRPIRLSFDAFSGEVTGGLLGTPAGQVFFSPAFGASVPNSVIQVENVSVCSRAFDVYTLPSLPDPQILFTFPAPSGTSALLGVAGGVLRASAYRLGLAVMNLSDAQEDTILAPTDETPEGLLEEPLDITRASFLNDDRWRISPEFILGVPGSELVDGQTFTLNDGVNPRTRFEFNSSGGVSVGNVAVAFTAGDSASTVATAIQTAINGVAATLNIVASAPVGSTVPLTNTTPVLNQAFRTANNLSSITAVAGASLIDGETFTLDDGVNTPTVFEFDDNASVSPGNVAVPFTGGDTAATVAASIQTAINGVLGTLDIVAQIPDGSFVRLTNIDPAIGVTETVADVGFLVYPTPIGPGPTVGPFPIV